MPTSFTIMDDFIRLEEDELEEALTNSTYARTWNEDEIIKIFMTFLYTVIFLFGTTGNIIFTVVLIKNKVLHTATNFYLWSMSCSDLIVVTFGLPFEFYSLWSDNPFFGSNYSVFHSLLLEVSTNASILTITVFTIERFIGICHPLRSQTMSQLGRVPKVIFCIWIFSLLTTVPVILTHPSLYEDQSDYDIDFTSFFIIVSFMLLFVFPMFIITYLYSRIVLELKISESRAKLNVDSKNDDGLSISKELISRNKDVVKVLVAVVLSFFLCFSPFQCQRLLSVYGDQEEESVFLALRILTHVSGVFLYLSTCMNPVLYHLMSDRFRKAFWATFSRSSSTSDHLNLYFRTQWENRRRSSYLSNRSTKISEMPSMTSSPDQNFISFETESPNVVNEIVCENSNNFKNDKVTHAVSKKQERPLGQLKYEQFEIQDINKGKVLPCPKVSYLKFCGGGSSQVEGGSNDLEDMNVFDKKLEKLFEKEDTISYYSLAHTEDSSFTAD